jgi:hypothetical protein
MRRSSSLRRAITADAAMPSCRWPTAWLAHGHVQVVLVVVAVDVARDSMNATASAAYWGSFSVRSMWLWLRFVQDVPLLHFSSSRRQLAAWSAVASAPVSRARVCDIQPVVRIEAAAHER